MARKTEIIETSIIATTPKKYEVTIRGMGGLLMNQMPDLSVSKAEKKEQTKIDPIERERKEWREKAYAYEDGEIYIPGENIHECLKEACKYWGQKIPGEGKKTYTDVVASSVVCENLDLGITKEDLIPFGKAVNGNPSRGKKSGAKVYKIRPLIQPWGGTFIVHVFDGRLTPGILGTIFTYGGTFKGLCDWRPTYGRFELVSIKEV